MKRDNISIFSAIDSMGSFSESKHIAKRTCPLCDSNQSKTLLEMKDFQFFTDSKVKGKRVTLRDCQCLDCLTVYRNPSFTQEGFDVLFAEAGYSYGSTAQRPKEQIDWLQDRGLLTPGISFLDVGCYEGTFLSQLPESIIRMGVDIDAPAINRGAKKYPEIFLNHSSFDTYSPPKAPEIITLFHVLEHLPNPLQVLRRLRKISSSNSKLVVEVPILEMGETNDIVSFFSPQHLTHFSENSLKMMLKKAGWSVLEIHQMDDYNGCRVLAKKDKEFDIEFTQSLDLETANRILATRKKAKNDINKRLKSIPTGGKVIIWGAGVHTEVLYQESELFHDIERKFLLVDSDLMKQAKRWRGIQIESPEVLKSVDFTDLHLVISSYGGQPSIKANALELGVPLDRIISLYETVHVC
jgi:hypothetical protein